MKIVPPNNFLKALKFLFNIENKKFLAQPVTRKSQVFEIYMINTFNRFLTF